MKKFLLTSILAVLVAFGTTVRAQEYPDEYLGLPGDNLNLFAVMKLFQESETLEAFERNLNDQNSRINNLDLNGDNYVDYIMVFDYVDGDVHTIVLRVALGKNEFQDVAVFTVRRFANRTVQIQLIGDEALYGENYIIEPNYAETPNPGYMGKNKRKGAVNVVYTSYYEVADWPMIHFIYLPDYYIWHSSWYWGYYPSYWNPWQPYYWHYYYGYHYHWCHHYYTHYRHWHHPRYSGYHEFYYAGFRSHSPKVHEQINKGGYQSTYSHPEQRRNGEALFTSMHPDQEKRTEQNTPVISQRRSSSAQISRTQTSTRTTTGTARRSENVTSTRSSADPSIRQSTGTSRRSTSTSADDGRTIMKSAPEENTVETRRPAATVNDRPAVKSSSDQSTGESRRPAAYVNERPVAKPSSDDPAPVRRTVVAEPEREVTKSRPAEEAAEYRRQPEPVQERVVSRPQPSPSQPERKVVVESKSETVERRTEKPQKPDDPERSIR
ncbi:MAG: hypothetical protein A2Z69_00120 [Bacteroidetes bacterium RBG_13_44_24]|nr:MAG: hypothetical protein A2Z69_00120 [Bacteroidetes bacterium RBG_13_44_24]